MEWINILGYSVGIGLVLIVLDEIVFINLEKFFLEIYDVYKFGNVLLVCSDVDCGIFEN